ncbi:MAG TPA: hypothetical protein VFL90_02695, partial [Methylomirabilota bacterium]|nr:hypothetical protein [Methylomirabilota bacterium]
VASSLRYRELRRLHFVNALRTLARRQRRALVLVAAILGPVVVPLLVASAAGFEVLVDPATSPIVRLAIYLAWLGATGLVVLALREPVFMLAARPFLRALPIARSQHLASDVRAIAIAYSLLWLPIAHFLGKTWWLGGGVAARLPATAVVGVAVLLGIASHALALHLTPGAVGLLAAAAVLFSVAPAGGPAVMATGLGAAVALAALALWRFHERLRRSPVFRPVLAHASSRFATATALAGPVAWRDLRHALGLRLAILAACLAAGSAMAQEGSFCGKAGGLYIVQCAIAALALQRVPALVDERLRQSLPWLFRLARARRRSIASAFLAAMGTFAVYAGVSTWIWRGACLSAPWARLQFVAALVFGAALGVLGGVALRWNEASSWVATACVLLLAFVLGFS